MASVLAAWFMWELPKLYDIGPARLLTLAAMLYFVVSFVGCVTYMFTAPFKRVAFTLDKVNYQWKEVTLEKAETTPDKENFKSCRDWRERLEAITEAITKTVFWFSWDYNSSESMFQRFRNILVYFVVAIGFMTILTILHWVLLSFVETIKAAMRYIFGS